MTLSELKNKKIAILGLGVNNRKLVDYLRAKQVKFDVIDGWQKAEELVGKLDDYQVIFRTPGLSLSSLALRQAASKGAMIWSQTKLFFDLCPCPIIGVTGTKGKGTTATLISQILEAAALRQAQGSKAYLAGNIGRDPFEFLDLIKPQDWVVLELSSFQLQDLHRSPHIAVVLRITPEHLDYHENLQEYIDAKKTILKFQTAADFKVLNYDSEVTRDFAKFSPAKVFWTSLMQEVKPGCFVSGEKIMLNSDSESREIMSASEVGLVGKFNLENITAGIAASGAAGVDDAEVIRKAVRAFRGLPHRLELAAEIQGVKFYDDSCSTTPETAEAAISAFAEPLILIVGGSEKKSDYSGLAEAIAKGRIKALIPIGITGPVIAKLSRAAGFDGRILDVNLENMESIVAEANKFAEPGEVVLLSPASASFDMFANYQQRGELFQKYVNKLTTHV